MLRYRARMGSELCATYNKIENGNRNALLDLNRDYIESIRLNSKLHAGTYIRVPDIPRFSSRQQIQPQR